MGRAPEWQTSRAMNARRCIAFGGGGRCRRPRQTYVRGLCTESLNAEGNAPHDPLALQYPQRPKHLAVGGPQRRLLPDDPADGRVVKGMLADSKQDMAAVPESARTVARFTHTTERRQDCRFTLSDRRRLRPLVIGPSTRTLAVRYGWQFVQMGAEESTSVLAAIEFSSSF